MAARHGFQDAIAQYRHTFAPNLHCLLTHAPASIVPDLMNHGAR